MSDYNDGRIECGADGLRIHMYYFPAGTKRIDYAKVRDVRRVDISAFTGRARIWGTANPRYWANLDPARPRKKSGLVLDVGGFVKPLITPDDVDAVETVLRERAKLGPSSGASSRGPII